MEIGTGRARRCEQSSAATSGKWVRLVKDRTSRSRSDASPSPGCRLLRPLPAAGEGQGGGARRAHPSHLSLPARGSPSSSASIDQLIPSLREKPAGIAQLAVAALQHPLRDRVVTGEVHLRLGAQRISAAFEHRRHQRAAAEMAVERDVEQARRLVFAQIFERVGVDIIIASGLSAQDPVVDEIAPGKGDDVAASSPACVAG